VGGDELEADGLPGDGVDDVGVLHLPGAGAGGVGLAHRGVDPQEGGLRHLRVGVGVEVWGGWGLGGELLWEEGGLAGLG